MCELTFPMEALLLLWKLIASTLLNNGGGGGESDETSRIFCGHVSFPEMNGEKGVYGGQSQIIIKKGG